MNINKSLIGLGVSVVTILSITSCSNPEPTQSRYLDENSKAAEAEIRANTPQPLVEDLVKEVIEEPDPTIKGSFLTVTYTLDAPPETTTGDDATFNPETGVFTFYSTIQQGSYEGYKYNYECRGRIHYEEKFRSTQMKKTGMVCNTKNDFKGMPVSVTVTDPADGFLSTKTTFQF